VAISTTNAHVSRALDFFQNDKIYFAIGRTTPWPNDVNGKTELEPSFQPPLENKELAALEELIGYKKVESIFLVVPDATNGTITYQSLKWRIVPIEQAYTEKARHVYMTTSIQYDELPLGFYRQVGVYSGVERAVGVAVGKNNLLPVEAKEGFGILEVVDNRGPSNRQNDQKEILSIAIEF
jgi:hypothetical protein